MSRRQITLEELIRRATGGRNFNRHALFRPSLSYYLLKDPFWLWCEHHAPKSAAVEETTRYEELRMQQGVEYEARWVKANFPQAVEIQPSFGFTALKNTFRAMLDGATAIYQPQLWDLARDSYGKGDLLIRDDSEASDLGPFHYRVVEIKRSKSLQESHILQAAFYTQNIGMLQGYLPREFTVVLKDSAESVGFDGKDADLDAARRLWIGLRDGSVTPEMKRPPNAANSPWRIYANQRAHDERDLVLLAGIPKRERDKLRRAAVLKVDQLWNLSQEEISEIIGARYGEIAHYVAQAYKLDRPIMKAGRDLKIPRAKRLLYFDFETSDSVHPSEPPHTYLIGCYDGSRDQFVKFLARGAEDEGRIFSEFLDYVGDPRDVCLYHWTDFEIHQMRQVARRWPLLSAMIEQIIDKCVDLKEAIQSAVYLPVPSFSIKCVAPALGFRWRQKDVGAYQSMVCYWDYLENKDLFAIDRALTYNEDDCMAMWHVDQSLAMRIIRL
ncbi:MAG TPA: TM0106 family RecB-like putative nuclease [Candidatus Limnocylindrales bacterium]|nr:TM0106 family RecB-like putative nuclease [Candidatus Limnocylindrales bacterium]